ncbi:MAG: ABC transporter ATP-binding protein [Betaproteobacteria bacterium]
MMSAALRLHAASKTFANGVAALAPVDLAVAQGEFVALVGPSGCGKSTLLRLAAGLEQPSSGRVERADARIGYVFQDATLMPWASVARNVRLPLERAGVPRADADARVAAQLARVGLADFAHTYPRQLSGGMKMRASLARALVAEPALLLMDEPFGALDDLTRTRLDDEVRALAVERGLTVLFVTHNLAEALFLADRVLLFSPRPGRIVAEQRVEAPARDAAFRTSAEFAGLLRGLHSR